MFDFLFHKKYKTGLALSGGGARGFAHIGALKAMEELGIKPDVLAGVSAGAIVSVMYASGLSPDDILDVFDDISFRDLTQVTIPKEGFFKTDKLQKFLTECIKYKNLEDLPIPTLIGATDIDKGNSVMFDSGSIAKTVAASCCIPIVFQPVKINGINYVDGGVLHNLPASVLRADCDKLIGVNCSPIVTDKYNGSIIDIASRTYDLISRSNANADMKQCDLVIETTGVSSYNVFDIDNMRQIASDGYRDAMLALRDYKK
ncbi:MAG: patatin-like phospholipase family protein [Bacteroidales bacterium]